MNVGAADTTRAETQQDLARPDFGRIDGFDPQILLRVNPASQHDSLLP
jgi:hypothetical protein